VLLTVLGPVEYVAYGDTDLVGRGT
jgi:hypothetical protein